MGHHIRGDPRSPQGCGEGVVIKVMLLDRHGHVMPVSYDREAQLQENAERFDSVIFFYPEDSREIQAS